jgi:hypothetical protein
MNSDPLSESIPWSRKGRAWRISSRAVWTRASLFPRTARVSPPRCGDVGDVERMGELPVGAGARGRDQVQLGEARHGHIPVVRLQRNVVLEQRPRLGAPVAPGLERSLGRSQAAIDLARTDGPQGPAHRRRQPEPAAGPGQPQREQGLEPHRPGIAGGLPNHGQRLDHGHPVRGRPTAPPGPRPPRGRAVEEPERRLPVVAGGCAELIEDRSLGLPVAWR